MSTDKGSLLLVDDDHVTRNQLARGLERNGFRVAGVADGAGALDRIAQGGLELVLLDVVMDGLSGLEVLEQIRQKHSVTDLPVIMATSKDETQDVVEALKRGANDYVTKPFDFPVVLARVQSQLALKRSVDQIRELEQSLVQRNAELQTANERMQHELEAATAVQKALLPSALPTLAGAAFAWHFKPCDELAGDLLNVIPLDDRHVALYVLDVSGHGTAAALLAVMVHRALGQLLPPGRQWAPPSEVGRRLHDEFPWNPTTRQYFTLQQGVLDLVSGEFRFIAAGHPGPILLPRDGLPRDLKHPGCAIGFGDGTYEEHTLTLNPGDRLFLYSDGLPEAFNQQMQSFGKDRVLATVAEGRTFSLPDSLSLLRDAIDRWCGDGAPHDDVSILGVERT